MVSPEREGGTVLKFHTRVFTARSLQGDETQGSGSEVSVSRWLERLKNAPGPGGAVHSVVAVLRPGAS